MREKQKKFVTVDSLEHKNLEILQIALHVF